MTSTVKFKIIRVSRNRVNLLVVGIIIYFNGSKPVYDLKYNPTNFDIA